MTPEIKAMLEPEHQSPEINKLLTDIKCWLKHSRGEMKQRYSAWDKNYRIFKGERCADEQDLEARANEEPEKMIVPMSYTQVMTFVTFVFMLYKQNRTFYELNAQGAEDNQLIQSSELLLERDLRHNTFDALLYQILLNLGRFGFAVTKTTWKVVTQPVEVEVPGEPINFQGLTLPGASSTITEQAVKFEGNEIVSISPYRILPDMRLPLARWKEGQFIADEQEFHISYFQELERQDKVVGVQYLSKMDSTKFKESGRGFDRFSAIDKDIKAKEKSDNDFMCISTEGHFRLIPSLYGLGDEDYPIDFFITIANDERIIGIERAGYLHGEFCYDISQFSPDDHAKLNLSLSDTVDALQETITWLFNARLISLRQGLDKHLVVDPSVIDMVGLEARSPIIQLRKGAPKTGISNFIQQLKVSDPTVQNIPEAETLMKIMQLVTGVNENAMGQYAPGRRSATENRAANQGAASRMVLHARLIWVQQLDPMGRKMLSNLRQGISYESFIKVIGEQPQSSTVSNEELYDQFAPSDPRALIGNEDFFVFDGTNSSEKQYMAQTLQELIVALLSNPEMAMLTGFDVTSLIDETLTLKGIRNVARLKKPIEPPILPGAPPALPGSGPLIEAEPGLDQLPVV